jgi:hypothetical protein
MPKWVVVTKGSNKGKLGYCVSVHDEGLESRAVRWGSGHFDPGKRTGSRTSSANLRDATDAEIKAHFKAFPDDEWQCVDQDDTKGLPFANMSTEVKNDAGQWVTWRIKTSLSNRGFVELIDPTGVVLEYHPTSKAASARLDEILGIGEEWEDGDILPEDEAYDGP